VTFVVIAIDVTSSDVDLRSRLRGTARKFAPHITILPRVRTSELRSRAVGGWKELLAAAERLRHEPLELRGPVRVTDDMDWHECMIGCRGRSALLELHRLVTERLLHPGSRCPGASFFGDGYRPHLTTAWHSRVAQASLPHRITVHAVNVAIYSYQSVPWAGIVRREALQ
jgi:hypothetical protein